MPERILIEDANDIVLTNHSEVDQILGNPPSWILRWGITLILVTVIIFGLVSWLIKYPDVITAGVTISTENPPIRVISKTSGKVTELRVKNNQIVEKSDILAIIDNPAKLEDIKILEEDLLKLKRINTPKGYLHTKISHNLNLGDLQPYFAELNQKVRDYQYFLNSSSVFKKINNLDDQIGNTHQLISNLREQKKRLIKEIAIAKSNYDRYKKLNKEGIASDLELEKTETQLLQYQRQLDILENQIVSNEMQTEQLSGQIIDLTGNRKDGRSSRELGIKKDIDQMEGLIKIWRQTFLITAPISGKVSFSSIWNEQQFIDTNQEVLTIVPEKGVGKLTAKATLPIENSGKVKSSQKVNIRLDGYPYQEYGIIESSLKNISLVPVTLNAESPKSYILEINLPDSLITSYNKKIPFRQEMQGTANIITEDRRVLERVFDRVNNILKN